jgi:hypothetical protein
MNNILWLIDARISASEKGLPVTNSIASKVRLMYD